MGHRDEAESAREFVRAEIAKHPHGISFGRLVEIGARRADRLSCDVTRSAAASLILTGEARLTDSLYVAPVRVAA